MAQRTDIRRIGKYLRQHGADGSLAAWVEAELDRVDLPRPRRGELRALREDLTVPERELIIRALLDVALTPASVQVWALDAAAAVGVELGIDAATVDYLVRSSCGWSIEQARLLASLGLSARTTPAELEHAQALRLTITSDRLRPATADTTVSGSPAVPTTATAHPVELPPLGEATHEIEDTSNDEVTEAGGTAVKEDSGIEALADALRRAIGQAPHQPDVVRSAVDHDLADDPPTVEMSREALRALSQRSEPAAPPVPAAAPPALTTAQDPPRAPQPPKHGRPPPFTSIAKAFQDGPPSIGFSEREVERLGAAFDRSTSEELPPLDWGDNAFTVNEFTLSERLDSVRFELPEREDPTLMVDRSQIRAATSGTDPRRPEAGKPPIAPSVSPTFPDASALDGTPTPRTQAVATKAAPPSAPAPARVATPEPAAAPQPPVDEEAWLLPSGEEDVPRGLTDEVPLAAVRLPSSWEAPPSPGFDTAELLAIDPDQAGPASLDSALAKLFSRRDPDEFMPVHASDDEPPELSLDAPDRADDDIPELDLDDDAARWVPPAATGDDTGGLTRELIEERPGLPRPDAPPRGLQPLDERLLRRAWSPPVAAGPTTQELDIDDPDDLDVGEAVSDGLTAELKPIIDEKPRTKRRGAPREGLTQDLQPLFDAPARQRRRGAPREGLTQDLQLLLDDED